MSYVYTLLAPAVEDLPEMQYVGRTSHIVNRFQKHQTGKGAKCLHDRPNIVMVSLEDDKPQLELVRTLCLMQKHGISKVRGGPFVKRMHSEEDIRMIKNLIESEMFSRSEDDVSKMSPSASPVKRVREDEARDMDSSPTSTKSDVSSNESRVGLRWTALELARLRNLIQSKATSSEAVKLLKRSLSGIDAKSRTLVSDALKKDSSETVSKFLQRTAEEMQTVLNGGSFFSNDE